MAASADPTVILSYARTPMGAMQGALADASATDLGGFGIAVGARPSRSARYGLADPAAVQEWLAL